LKMPMDEVDRGGGTKVLGLRLLERVLRVAGAV